MRPSGFIHTLFEFNDLQNPHDKAVEFDYIFHVAGLDFVCCFTNFDAVYSLLCIGAYFSGIFNELINIA
jgi:hypothetical protein